MKKKTTLCYTLWINSLKNTHPSPLKKIIKNLLKRNRWRQCVCVVVQWCFFHLSFTSLTNLGCTLWIPFSYKRLLQTKRKKIIIIIGSKSNKKISEQIVRLNSNQSQNRRLQSLLKKQFRFLSHIYTYSYIHIQIEVRRYTHTNIFIFIWYNWVHIHEFINTKIKSEIA